MRAAIQCGGSTCCSVASIICIIGPTTIGPAIVPMPGRRPSSQAITVSVPTVIQTANVSGRPVRSRRAAMKTSSGPAPRSFHNITATQVAMIVAPAATFLAMVFGTLASIGLTRGEFRGKALVMSLLISPMVVPVVIIGVASYLFFAPLGLGNSYLSLILVHAVLGVPFVIITVSATLQGFNYNLVRAAASLGAPPLTTFFKVTLPLIAPGVISGALFAFATSFDEVVVTLFLAGPEQATLPRQMFSGIRENLSPTIAAAATLLIGFSIVLLLVLEWLRGRSERLRTSMPE